MQSEDAAPWAAPLIAATAMCVSSSSNFKTRTHATAALAIAIQSRRRSFIGEGFIPCALAVCAALRYLDEDDGYTLGGAQASSAADYRMAPALKLQLSSALIVLLSHAEPSDAKGLHEVLLAEFKSGRTTPRFACASGSGSPKAYVVVEVLNSSALGISSELKRPGFAPTASGESEIQQLAEAAAVSAQLYRGFRGQWGTADALAEECQGIEVGVRALLTQIEI